MLTNECKLNMAWSDMAFTTSIDKVSRSAVRKDGFTSDEVAIVNHSVEWLEHTHNDGEQVWKHYGPIIAHISLAEGAPQAEV